MKSYKKSLLALALALGSASASAVVVGGIDVGAPGSAHFQASEVYENFVSTYTVDPTATTLGVGGVASLAPGAVLAGYGRVNTINSNLNFCSGGPCELTFRFYDYKVVAGATASTINFTGGKLDFYVGTGASLNFTPFAVGETQANLLAQATDGTPWLSLVGNTYLDLLTGRTGTLLATGTNFGTGTVDAGTGIGQLNVAGGLADVVAALNTNRVLNNLACTPGVNCSDFDLTTSFSVVGRPPSGYVPLAGVSSVAGFVAVPAPGSLALLALGMLAMGLMTPRRKV
ncbi:hypothetical protein AAKU55_001505 [Oxalobacteraceae bacterium GrIS 1.11]